MRHCSKPLRMTNSWLSPSGSWDLIRAGSTSLPLASSLHSNSLVKKVIDVVVVLSSITKIEILQPLPTTFTHFFAFLSKMVPQQVVLRYLSLLSEDLGWTESNFD